MAGREATVTGGFCNLYMKNKILNIYIDGFNLYYCALKGTKYKWLNVEKLCSFYFKKFSINKIKYFTANVKSRDNNIAQPLRQQIYLRALKTIPNLKIIKGSYQRKIKWMPLASEINNKRTKIDIDFFGKKIKLPIFTYKNKFQYVPVHRSEEKGSDVNLATHLLKDAYENKFDFAVVVSNDSDLKEPISIVNKNLNLPVFILNPDKTQNRKLKNVAKYTQIIREGVLKASQFPNELKDKHGTITKPSSW